MGKFKKNIADYLTHKLFREPWKESKYTRSGLNIHEYSLQSITNIHVKASIAFLEDGTHFSTRFDIDENYRNGDKTSLLYQPYLKNEERNPYGLEINHNFNKIYPLNVEVGDSLENILGLFNAKENDDGKKKKLIFKAHRNIAYGANYLHDISGIPKESMVYFDDLIQRYKKNSKEVESLYDKTLTENIKDAYTQLCKYFNASNTETKNRSFGEFCQYLIGNE